MKFVKTAALVLSAILVVVVFGISVREGMARMRAGSQMAESAQRFLKSLNPEQRAKAVFNFDDAERLNWHFVPRARKGLPFKEMSPEQRELATALFKTGFGQRGYAKAQTIISLENILKEIEQGRGPVRDPELYFFSIFGEPTAKGRWGWRFEGHHLAFNFTIVNGTMVATTPGFFGANPAEVRQGPRKGLRALAGEEDLARALIKALDANQQATAIFDKVAPKDIISMNSGKADPLSPSGIAAGALSDAQRKMLQALLDEYLSRMPEDVAKERFDKIKRAGLEKVHFAWAGELEPNRPHYYRLQGPTFLVEYDDTQNDANHIHSVWRDFEGDFGRDLLRDHYKEAPHGK